MKSAPHIIILESYFFAYIDRGIGADATPLFTQTLEGRPLVEVIAETFQILPGEAGAAIESARQEVWL